MTGEKCRFDAHVCEQEIRHIADFSTAADHVFIHSDIDLLLTTTTANAVVTTTVITANTIILFII